MTEHPMSGDHESPTPDEVAETLRLCVFAIDRARAGMVAFGPSMPGEPGFDSCSRDFDRLGEAKQRAEAMLTRLPPEPPLTAEQEAEAAEVIRAALNRRFG